jgi:type III restriction enzyme
VGRGLRLCVDSSGVRLDAEAVGDSVHDINKLTVIASESYKSFVAALQADMRDVLYDRPTQATIDYFDGKTVRTADGPVKISTQQAKDIYRYLVRNDYVDDTDQITDSYRADRDAGTFAPLPVTLQPMADEIHRLIQGVFDESVLEDMVDDGNATKVYENPLNENFMKKEFQALWERINHRYAYKVEFDSEELIRKCVESLNANLRVTKLTYVRTKGEQRETLTKDKIESGSSFDTVGVKTSTLDNPDAGDIKYDLVGKIAEGTVLTRRTVVRILQGLREDKVYMFRDNPEEFISKVIRLINEQKATMIVEHISYSVIDGTYDSAIFTAEKATQPYSKAFHAQKAIQDYVYTDGYAADGQSVERRFAEDLDASEDVVVYAKLPKGFHIPTPVGNYAPDWAIAFKEGSVKHIYFVAETKGSLSTMDLKPIEKAKIDCAKKLFNEMSFSGVRYDVVNSYAELMNIVSK